MPTIASKTANTHRAVEHIHGNVETNMKKKLHELTMLLFSLVNKTDFVQSKCIVELESSSWEC